MEVFKALPEGTLAELIEGKLNMSPSPSTTHQKTHKNLLLQLEAVVKEKCFGEVWYAPHDVFLDERSNAVQPDLFVTSNGQANIIKEDGIHGSPALIIEIISASNARLDLVTKKNLYEKFGVKEYWIVDPKTKQSTGYILKDGIFEPLQNGIGKLKSVILNHEFTF